MTRINLGVSDKHTVNLDLDILLRTRLLIQANSGGGKSWLLRRIAEQGFGKVQIIIVDPEGEFATLREKYDYVLVGKGGETPADVRSAQLVALKLLELHASAVCDLYEMKSSQRHLWVKTFLEALIDAPKNLWHPVLVIVDEAHGFCPEKGAGESEASDAMIDLATKGRKRGFCAIFATQRLGKLRKDAAAELTNILVGQTFIDIDRKRAADALGIPRSAERTFYDEMKVVEPGSFWALGRAVSKDRILVEIGGVETTHPEPGSSAKRSFDPPPPTEKIKSMLPKLSDLPKEAEQKARTEAELRSEISALNRQLRSRPTVQVPEVKVERVEVAVFQHGEVERLENAAAALSTMARDLFAIAKMRMQPQRAAVIPLTRMIPRAPAPAVRSDAAQSTGRLPEGERKILIACGQYPDGVQRDQLTVLTGYKRSTRDAYVQRLRERGLVDARNDGVFITDSGFGVLGSDFQPLPVGDELRQFWLRNSKLPQGEKKVLQVLCDVYPDSMERELITENTGFKRSTRDAYLQRLGSRRLVLIAGPSIVRASDSLFG